MICLLNIEVTHTHIQSTHKIKTSLILPTSVPPQREFCVCYPVLYGGYSNYLAIQQSIEYTRLMGASHVFIYTQNTTAQVAAILDWYRGQGHTTVLSVPGDPANQAWYHGQILAINDCHYRARYSCRHLVVQDLDEFILPLRHTNWREILSDVTARERGRSFGREIASFSFRNTFYCATRLEIDQWAWLKTNMSLTEKEAWFVNRTAVALLVEMHHVGCLPFPTRSKAIYRPLLVKEPGIHRPRSFWPGSRYVVVDPDVAFLAHHRKTAEPNCTLDMRVRPFFRDYIDVLMSGYDDVSTVVHSYKYSHFN